MTQDPKIVRCQEALAEIAEFINTRNAPASIGLRVEHHPNCAMSTKVICTSTNDELRSHSMGFIEACTMLYDIHTSRGSYLNELVFENLDTLLETCDIMKPLLEEQARTRAERMDRFVTQGAAGLTIDTRGAVGEPLLGRDQQQQR